jgi:phospholipid-binding lipoprotein MlaA
MKRRAAARLLLAGMLALLSACASQNVTPKEDRSPADPWEPLNRTMWRIHEPVDRVTLKLVARGYKAILPGFIRQGVTNFSRNLFVPRSIVANFLQGKPKDGMSEVARLFVNSTVGIGGLVDITGMSGLEHQDETFRETFAVWGAPPGPFVMIPILGPFTLTDALALPFDLTFDPLWHYEVSSVRDRLYFLRVINLRANLLPADKLLEGSNDPYITMRESFLQNRLYHIHDGDPPVDDDFYDDFYDEEFDDEFVDENATRSEEPR